MATELFKVRKVPNDRYWAYAGEWVIDFGADVAAFGSSEKNARLVARLLNAVKSLDATLLLTEIEEAFSTVYNLIPESEFEELGEHLNDAFHEPMERLKKLLADAGETEMKTIVIDGFSARMTESMEGREGLAYRLTIRYNGKVVGEAYNAGDGGADRFDFKTKQDRAVFDIAVEKNVPKTEKLYGMTVRIFERDAHFLTMLLGD